MKLIVVDGLDGVGKDTHALLIKQYYEQQDKQVVVRSHPSSDSFFGRQSKQALLGQGTLKKIKASMFYAFDVLSSVRRFYYHGKADVIIMVRYLMGTAYLPGFLVKMGYTFFANFVPTSEYMFFLDADPKVLLERVQTRQNLEMFETLDAFNRVRKKALPLVTSGWHVVDTSGSVEETFTQIKQVLVSLDEK